MLLLFLSTSLNSKNCKTNLWEKIYWRRVNLQAKMSYIFENISFQRLHRRSQSMRTHKLVLIRMLTLWVLNWNVSEMLSKMYVYDLAESKKHKPAIIEEIEGIESWRDWSESEAVFHGAQKENEPINLFYCISWFLSFDFQENVNRRTISNRCTFL